MTSIYTLRIMPKASVDTLMPEFALHCLTGMIYLPNRRVIYATFIAANSKYRPFVIVLIFTSRKIPIWLKRCKDWRWYLLPGNMNLVFISFWSMSAVFPVFVIICILCHILYLGTVMLLMSFYFLYSRKLKIRGNPKVFIPRLGPSQLHASGNVWQQSETILNAFD